MMFAHHTNEGRSGVSLIEVVLSIGIMALLFGGIYTAYVGILDAIANSSVRTQAAAIAHREIEIVRNISYENVGTVNGVPAGVLPQEKSVTSTDGKTFSVKTTVRNIDDPFDGTLGGAPNDTAPADYKLVELEIGCVTCAKFIPLTMTTTVAPKNLEGALSGGSLFVNVFDASGEPVQNATVHVVNASVTPAIDLTDTTNSAGVLQLVGVSTSTQRYQIAVSKSGYSSDRTYPPGEAANPNPVKPHATVAAQTLTQLSFAIDRTSTLNVKSSTNVCVAAPSIPFTLKGAKIIGTNPDTFKFSTSSITGAAGAATFSDIEWDTYTLAFAGSGYDVAGYVPLPSFVVNPNLTVETRMILATAALRSLLVTVKDAGTGAGIMGAAVSVANGAGYSENRITGRNTLTHTDWSGGSYISQSGGIDAESAPGSMRLAGPPYPTSTAHWLISQTFDVGASTSTYYTVAWSPASQPGQAGSDPVKFQIASNNDNATWNYKGPDGTVNTYYTVNGQAIASAHSGNRYLRYKAYLSTVDENVSPSLEDVRIDFYGVCVPQYQSFFTNMAAGDYTLTVSATGHQDATSSISIVNGWQETTVSF